MNAATEMATPMADSAFRELLLRVSKALTGKECTELAFLCGPYVDRMVVEDCQTSGSALKVFMAMADRDQYRSDDLSLLVGHLRCIGREKLAMEVVRTASTPVSMTGAAPWVYNTSPDLSGLNSFQGNSLNINHVGNEIPVTTQQQATYTYHSSPRQSCYGQSLARPAHNVTYMYSSTSLGNGAPFHTHSTHVPFGPCPGMQGQYVSCGTHHEPAAIGAHQDYNNLTRTSSQQTQTTTVYNTPITSPAVTQQPAMSAATMLNAYGCQQEAILNPNRPKRIQPEGELNLYGGQIDFSNKPGGPFVGYVESEASLEGDPDSASYDACITCGSQKCTTCIQTNGQENKFTPKTVKVASTNQQMAAKGGPLQTKITNEKNDFVGTTEREGMLRGSNPHGATPVACITQRLEDIQMNDNVVQECPRGSAPPVPPRPRINVDLIDLLEEFELHKLALRMEALKLYPFGQELRLDSAKISQLEYNHPRSLSTVFFKIMVVWMNGQSSRSDMRENLAGSLRNIDCVGLADELSKGLFKRK